MDRAGAHITHEPRPASGDFVLNIQIPVEYVRAVRIWVDHAIANSLAIEIEVGVRRACPKLGRGIRPNNLKGGSSGGVQAELIRKREHIENAKSSADGSLTIFPRVPRDTDARFEVLCRGII